MTDTPRSGFLNRWSRRKIDAREGKLADESSQLLHDGTVPLTSTEKEGPSDVATSTTAAQDPSTQARPVAGDAGREQEPALPSLEDVRALTAESDFAPFVSRSVAPDVKNAALKKLFTDPHYNVMDGLDIYIDDYSQQAPIPESMLRKMAVSKIFGFFEETPAAAHDPAPAPADLTDPSELPAPAAVSAAPAEPPATPPTADDHPRVPVARADHDDTDL